MADLRSHAVLGMTPPQTEEAIIAVRWPSVTAYMGGQPARLAHKIQQTAHGLILATLQLPQLWLICLAMLFVVPAAFTVALVGWGMLAPFYFGKVLPVLMTRYALTNRRVMIQHGWSLTPGIQVNLEDIKEVRVVPGTEQPFYLAADLEIHFGATGTATIPGVKEYKTFKVAIENAYLAWGRKAPPTEQKCSAAEMAKAK